MRVIGYIEHPRLKISIFDTEHRYPVKFEDGTREQIYRFRKSEALSGLTDVQQLVDEEFIAAVERTFRKMGLDQRAVLDRLGGGGAETGLPEII